MIFLHLRRAGLLSGLLIGLLLIGMSRVQASGPIAHAVLFYSPTCPHCHYVQDEVLPPLQARYGEQLAILEIDVTQAQGQELYQAMFTAFGLGEDRLGVPALVFDQTVLVGSAEIPAQLPGLIDAALAGGGNSWPVIAGLEALLAEGTPPTQELSPFQRDPLANSIALVLLIAMVISVFLVIVGARPPFNRPLLPWQEWSIPFLVLVGMGVAAYLAMIEVSGSEAVCGPVGDCNSVQQSEYARLFGVLPIGILGLVGYVAILAAWALRRWASGSLAHQAAVVLPLLCLLGTLFSIYLTFLEPFVIGATCMWCLSSAALMTALLWMSVPRSPVPTQRGRQRRLAH